MYRDTAGAGVFIQARVFMRLTRITLAIIALIIGAGFHLLVRNQLAEVEPQLFQATEEVMVDMANILAEVAEGSFQGGVFDEELLASAMRNVRTREINAEIFEYLKEGVGSEIYVTDGTGVVVYDSGKPDRVGSDFSRKRDVYLTLRGLYGARSSKDEGGGDDSSVLHVAAVIGEVEEPLGVLTVYKPKSDVLPIMRKRVAEIWWGTGLVGGGILFCVGVVFIWQYRPIAQLTEYTRSVEAGERSELPYLGMGKEVNTLARSLESMREALEGRQFAERYVQTLTHELKSPLAGIRGAAELLGDDTGKMSGEDRARFLENIQVETQRADRLLTRLLELSALESRKSLEKEDVLLLLDIVERSMDSLRVVAEQGGVRLNIRDYAEGARVRGDVFMLKAAFTNVLENAIDFSPEGGEVKIQLSKQDGGFRVLVEDEGEGIPEYALARIYERFYSLRHLKTGKKGTGLGLTLVKEVIELHRGQIKITSEANRGTSVEIWLPEV